LSTLKAEKNAGCLDIRPEIRKALNRDGIPWVTRVCQGARRSGREPKDWKTEAIIPMHKAGSSVITARAFSSFGSLEKLPSALKKVAGRY